MNIDYMKVTATLLTVLAAVFAWHYVETLKEIDEIRLKQATANSEFIPRKSLLPHLHKIETRIDEELDQLENHLRLHIGGCDHEHRHYPAPNQNKESLLPLKVDYPCN